MFCAFLLTDAKVLGALLEQRVGHFLDLDLLGDGQRCRGDLLASGTLLSSGFHSGLSSLQWTEEARGISGCPRHRISMCTHLLQNHVDYSRDPTGETRWPERKQKSVIQGHTHNRSSHIERLLQLHALLIYGGAHESKAGLDARWDQTKTARTNVKQGLGKTWPRGEYFDIEFLPKYTSDRDTTWPRITATSSPSRLTTLQAG